MDVEIERKAPAPGLKEKDEDEKSGIGKRLRGADERQAAGCLQPSLKAEILGPHSDLPGLTKVKPIPGIPGLGISRDSAYQTGQERRKRR